MAFSAGVFINTVDTTPDVLVWRLDRSQGLLTQDIHRRLKGHDGQVCLRRVVLHRTYHTADGFKIVSGHGSMNFVWEGLVALKQITAWSNTCIGCGSLDELPTSLAWEQETITTTKLVLWIRTRYANSE